MQKQFVFGLHDSRAAARVALDGNIESAVELSAIDLEALIKELSILRSQMVPEVPGEYDQSVGFTDHVMHPAWHLDATLIDGTPFLHYAHPGQGWQHVGFPPEVAVEIGNWMVKLGNQAVENAKVTPLKN